MDPDQNEDTRVFHRPSGISHVIIFHEKLIRRKEDRYVINIGLAFQKLGYKVTILTSQYDKHDCVADVKVGWFKKKFSEVLKGCISLQINWTLNFLDGGYQEVSWDFANQIYQHLKRHGWH